MGIRHLGPNFSLWVGGGWWGGWWWGGCLVRVVGGVIRLSFQSNSNSQKLSLWFKKNHYPPRWICMTHMWFFTEFPMGIIIFPGVLTKFNFSTKFPHLEKIVDLMKDLKYEHQSTFPLWGRVKLNFRDRYGKPGIYSKNSSDYQVFSLNSQKLTLWFKKKTLPMQMDLHHPYMFKWLLVAGWLGRGWMGGVIRLSFQ